MRYITDPDGTGFVYKGLISGFWGVWWYVEFSCGFQVPLSYNRVLLFQRVVVIKFVFLLLFKVELNTKTQGHEESRSMNINLKSAEG